MLNAQPHYAMGMAALHGDDFEAARRSLTEGLRASEHSGSDWTAALYEAGLALLAVLSGRLDDGATQVETVLAGHAASGAWYGVAMPRTLCQIAVRRGDLSSAEHWLTVAEQRPLDSEVKRGEVAWMRGAIAALEGNADAAVTAWDEAITSALVSHHQFYLRWIAPGFVRVAVATGDRRMAQEGIKALEEAERGARRPGWSGILAQCQAMVTGDRALSNAAIDLLRRSPRPLELADALVDAADLRRRRGGGAGAAELLEEAHQIYAVAGATHDAARTAPTRRSPTRPSRAVSGWDALTPTERRVVDPVTTGLTYRQIADELFVSRRTVETHVAKTFNKLGVRSRGELAALARQRDAAGNT